MGDTVLANVGTSGAVLQDHRHGVRVGTLEEQQGFRPVVGAIDYDGSFHEAEVAAERAKAERLAELPPPPKPRCTAETKEGNPCRGFATATGLCAGHSKAAKAG